MAQQPLWDGLYCSTKWWNSLPADYQEIIEDELYTATVNYSNYCVENEASMREELEAAGVVFHEADREAFAEMTKSVLDKYSISTELLETVAQIRALQAAGCDIVRLAGENACPRAACTKALVGRKTTPFVYV